MDESKIEKINEILRKAVEYYSKQSSDYGVAKLALQKVCKIEEESETK